MYVGAVYSSVSCWMLVGWMFFVWDGGFNVLIVFSEKDLAENCETLYTSLQMFLPMLPKHVRKHINTCIN